MGFRLTDSLPGYGADRYWQGEDVSCRRGNRFFSDSDEFDPHYRHLFMDKRSVSQIYRVGLLTRSSHLRLKAKNVTL